MTKKKNNEFVITGFSQDEVFERLSKIPDIHADVQRILKILEGDISNDRPGLVETVRRIDRRTLTNKSWIIGLWTSVTAIVSGFIYIIVDLYKALGGR